MVSDNLPDPASDPQLQRKLRELEPLFLALWPGQEAAAKKLASVFVRRILSASPSYTSQPAVFLCGPPGTGLTEAAYRASRLLYGKDAYRYSMAETVVPGYPADLPTGLRAVIANSQCGVVVFDEIEKTPHAVLKVIVDELQSDADSQLRNFQVVFTSSFSPKQLTKWLSPELAPRLGQMIPIAVVGGHARA